MFVQLACSTNYVFWTWAQISGAAIENCSAPAPQPWSSPMSPANIDRQVLSWMEQKTTNGICTKWSRTENAVRHLSVWHELLRSNSQANQTYAFDRLPPQHPQFVTVSILSKQSANVIAAGKQSPSSDAVAKSIIDEKNASPEPLNPQHSAPNWLSSQIQYRGSPNFLKSRDTSGVLVNAKGC